MKTSVLIFDFTEVGGGVWVAHLYPVRFWQFWFIFSHLVSHPPCWLVIGDWCGLAEGV